MKVNNWLGSLPLARAARTIVKRSAAVAVLAGGMIFAGQASADILITENFESATQTGPGAAGVFAASFGGTQSFGAYGTAQNYSGDDHTTALGGAGGSFYGHSVGIATYPSVSVTFSASDLALVSAGDANINFSGWLASYTADGNYTTFDAEFFDNRGDSLGSLVLVDGSVSNGDLDWNADNWSFYQTSQAVTFTAAESVTITYGGVGNDKLRGQHFCQHQLN